MKRALRSRATLVACAALVATALVPALGGAAPAATPVNLWQPLTPGLQSVAGAS